LYFTKIYGNIVSRETKYKFFYKGDVNMSVAAKHPGALKLEAAFQEFLATGVFPVEGYFAPEYQQWADGEQLNYDGFVQHAQALANRIQQGYSFDTFTIHEVVGEGERFVSRHSFTGTNAEGIPFTLLVLALFEMREGRFIRCWELSHVQGGDAVDRSLASTLS
jgi:hypothetical protein